VPSRPRIIDVTALPAAPLRELGQGRLAKTLYRLHRVLQICCRGRAALYAYVLCAQPVGHAAAQMRPLDHIRTEVADTTSPWISSFPRPAAVIRHRFDRGAHCDVVTVRGEFAGYLWLQRGHYDEDEVRCRYLLPEQAASVWDFDVYIEPRFRMSRALSQLWAAVTDRLNREGIRWTFSRISLFNPGSLAAHERMGATKVGLVLFLVIGRMQISWASGCRWLHVSVSERSIPTVTLTAPVDEAAVVMGLDSHGLAVARALSDSGIPVFAVEKDLALPGVASNRVNGVVPVRSFASEDLIPALLGLRRALKPYRRVALQAINDRHVEVIARNLDLLRGSYEIAWSSAADWVLQLQRKDALEAHSRARGLNYPRSMVFEGPASSADLQGFFFPVIVKPLRPRSAFKAELSEDSEALDALLGRQPDALPVLVQEYIAGDDSQLFFAALMLEQGHVICGMAGRKIGSHPPARGRATIAETTHAPEALELASKFFEGTGISGAASLELKRDPEGRFWVIEPTVGRTDSWAQLCITAGFNQPLAEFHLAMGRSVDIPMKPLESIWYDTERDPAAWVRLCLAQRTSRPMRKTSVFPYLGHDDARPICRAIKRMLKMSARSLFRYGRPNRLSVWPAIAAAGVMFALCSGDARAQVNPQACGLLANAIGPWDYRMVRGNELQIVEGAHFTNRVAMAMAGERGYLGQDLNYTLSAFPNHHRALAALQLYETRLPRLGKQDLLPRPVECYFERAIRFKNDDTVARMLYAQYLYRHARPAEAVVQLEATAQMSADNGMTQHNIGLVYAEAKDYQRALAQAHRAMALGFTRPTLRDLLQRAGQWREPDDAQAETQPTADRKEGAATSASVPQ
jgi:predicted ATP-grasp superfamily ATP-dependent carboligase